MSSPPIKKIALWLAVIFLLYAIFTSPDEAADIVGSAWDILSTAFTNVGRFFDELLKR